ncbi:MAG TPA: hypothetical protein VEI48_09500 [Candidatus Sulfotelmatobacter sp.]|nr:hypothetical protein [Candidatus Sulfotelmatobacter sp.]
MSGPPDPERPPQSYSERYAGTQWGRPLEPPPQPEQVAEPRRGVGCLRLLVGLVGLFWFLPSVVGIVSYIAAGSAGEVEGIALDDTLRTLILIGVISNIFWAAFGLKLIIAPGRRTLGCSALLGLFYAVIFGALLGLVLQSGQGTVLLEVILAIPVVVFVLVMLISLLGRDAWD